MGETPLYRPRGWKKEVRRRQKMVKKAAWYRPADCVGFFPPTPGSELAKDIEKILKEEGKRIEMDLRAIETGGVSLASEVRP